MDMMSGTSTNLNSYYGRDGRPMEPVCSKSPANRYQIDIPQAKMSHVRLVKKDDGFPHSPTGEAGILLGNYHQDKSRQTIQPNTSNASNAFYLAKHKPTASAGNKTYRMRSSVNLN
jgi:hypothetical protein